MMIVREAGGDSACVLLAQRRQKENTLPFDRLAPCLDFGVAPRIVGQREKLRHERTSVRTSDVAGHDLWPLVGDGLRSWNPCESGLA